MPIYAVATITQSLDVILLQNKPTQATKKTNSFLLIHLFSNLSNVSLLITYIVYDAICPPVDATVAAFCNLSPILFAVNPLAIK